MTWDVLLQRVPEGLASLDDMPDHFRPPSLGSAQEVAERLRAALPGVDFSDPVRGKLRGEGFEIELEVGADEACRSVMLHVRGGDEALEAVRRAAEALDAAAIDCGEGTRIRWDGGDPCVSLRAWRAHQSHVLDEGTES